MQQGNEGEGVAVISAFSAEEPHPAWASTFNDSYLCEPSRVCWLKAMFEEEEDLF